MSSPGPPTTPIPRRGPLRRWGVRIARAIVLVFAGLAMFLYFIQDRLVFPGSELQGQRDATLTEGENNSLLTLHTRDGTRITALFGLALTSDGLPIADVKDRPTILFFYGNGACMAYSTDVFDALRRLGVNVLIPDYEGYGMSAGRPSEAGCYATADAAYDYLLGRDDIDRGKIVAMGWSLGGAVAIDFASRRPVAGLITISAFTNLRDMAHRVLPWFPVSWILKYRFANLDKLPEIKCPILIIHGTRDDLVPFSMAARVAAAAGGKVTRFDVHGAGHENVFDMGGDAMLKTIAQFLNSL